MVVKSGQEVKGELWRMADNPLAAESPEVPRLPRTWTDLEDHAPPDKHQEGALEPSPVSHLQTVLVVVEQAIEDAAHNPDEEAAQMIISELRNIRNIATSAQQNLSGLGDTNRNLGRGVAWFCVVAFVLTFSQWHGLVAAVPKDSDEVYCWDLSSMFGIVWATGRVWIAAEIARRKMLPALFPKTHTVMARERKLKAVGNIVKATARLGAMVFMTALWWKFDLQNGLDMSYGAGIQCQVWSDAISRRIFYNAKFLLIAVMMWELSCLPSLSWDLWFHHLIIIVAMVATTDEQLLVPDDHASCSLTNGFALILMYGACSHGFKELAVSRFQHCSINQMALQFYYLRYAVIIHAVNQMVFYFVLPVVYLVFCLRTPVLSTEMLVLMCLVIVTLNVLEFYIGYITFIVMKSRQRKAGIASLFASKADAAICDNLAPDCRESHPESCSTKANGSVAHNKEGT